MNALIHGLISLFQKDHYHDGRKADDEEDEDDIIQPTVEVVNSLEYQSENNDASSSSSAVASTTTVPLIFSLIRAAAWSDVMDRCHTHPEEVKGQYQDQLGDTLLHWACWSLPPVNVIRTILQISPELATMVNQNGCLPLHLACCYRGSPLVLRELVQAYPESAGIPIQRNKCNNHAGTYPLHILCDYGCTVQALQVLLETPEGVATVDQKDGIFQRTPLQLLNERKNLVEFHYNLRELRNVRMQEQTIIIRNSRHGNDYNNNISWKDTSSNDADLPVTSTTFQKARDDLLESLNEMVLWKKTKLLVLAQYNKISGNGPLLHQNNDIHESNNNESSSSSSISLSSCTSILHAIVTIPLCPPALLEFAALLQIEDLLLPDIHGDLPLHIAVRSSDESSTIADLVAAQPAAAGQTDHFGHFPLITFLQRQPDSVWHGTVEKLVVANPLAIETLNNMNDRLYPWIWSKLAAPPNMSNNNNNNNIKEERINALFVSIRGNPSLFSI